MKAASRESLTAARERFDAAFGKQTKPALQRLGEQLFAVLDLLDHEPALRRHLADASTEQSNRVALADAVLSGKVSDPTMKTVRELVSSRWSAPVDLLDAIEAIARSAILGVAEKERSLEEVEDELFRFGRILDSQTRLRLLLADPAAPGQQRVDLLTSLIGGKVRPVTAQLLEQSVRSPRGRSLDRVAEHLAELAAARRDRYVAHVTAAAVLTGEQQERLASTLGRIYGREISLQIEIDPDLLGGLVVRVGDEIINGSVSGRLDEARHRLAG